MNRFGIQEMRESLWSDSRGVSSANVAILVAFAALAMPGFVALGDGLAENTIGRSSANPYAGSSATPRAIDGSWGDSSDFTGSGGGDIPGSSAPPDYWGGGEDTLFDVGRPGTTPWDQHKIQTPDTFTGTGTDFGSWGKAEGEENDANGQEAGFASLEDHGQGGAGSGNGSGSDAESGPGTELKLASNDKSGSPTLSFDSLSNLLAGYSTTSAAAASLSAGASAGEGGMTPEDAISAILDNPGAFADRQGIRDLEANGVRISLSSLQRVANGDDPELAAVAEFILGDRALRDALTGGGYAIKSDDLEEVASDVQNATREGSSWMAGDATSLTPDQIDLAIKSAEGGNPPGWARNSAHVLGADFDLLADSTGPNGTPRISSDTLDAVMKMNEEQWADFQQSRGINSNFSLEQVQGAATAAVESGLFDYLDAPPGLGVDANGLVGREMLLSFSDESQRQGDSWADYLRDDNATEASTSELRSEDGAKAMDGEPLVMKAFEGDLFSGTVGQELLRSNPRLAGVIRAEGLDRQAALGAEDVVQGAVGDCWAMSGLAAFAEKDPTIIRNAITDNRDGTYTVRLFDGEGNPVETTVDNEFAASAYSEDGALFAQTDRALWVGVMEKAMTEVLDGRNGVTDDMMVIDGGHDALIHQMLTGQQAETVLFQDINSSNATNELVTDLATTNSRVEESAGTRNEQLSSWVNEGRAITVTSSHTVSLGYLTESHSYTVMGVEGDKVLLRDPRGDEYGGVDGTADGVIEVSLEDFNKSFMSMTSSS